MPLPRPGRDQLKMITAESRPAALSHTPERPALKGSGRLAHAQKAKMPETQGTTNSIVPPGRPSTFGAGCSSLPEPEFRKNEALRR
jgi:hypothetical protein